jgi:SAM-dependent methyltransferase
MRQESTLVQRFLCHSQTREITMHPRVYEEYERIFSNLNITGSVLEIGAIPSRKSLLCMKSLNNVSERVGINLDGPHEFENFKIHKGNANSMDLFEDESFDVVLCNAMFEHDKYFWKTMAEIKRITKPGGIVVIGTPGYRYYKVENLKLLLRKAPLIQYLARNQYLNMFFTSTLTFQIHDAPGDYYRFSPQAFTEVFFEDFKNVEVYSIMLPPRIIGLGIK